ncbi:hypothetical protein OD917_18320 [Flavobacterium sp. SH_e]|uniref:hypothetical protein n=1 Tax=Flavobacterium TaxID=237 RepID=UPI0021E39245|nr:hypothetical protein [Flavobacterium sp. SH_e]MCV2486892.1 hypothetical protein [Flavobacterium sp. SH_e]
MAVTKIPLTKEDIILVKNRIKANSVIRLLGSGFTLIVLLIVYLSTGRDTSNDTFCFFKIAVIVINAFLLIGWLRDTNLYNDLKDRQKYVGTIKVKHKNYHYDSENNSTIYQIIFDEWRVGNVCFIEKFWNDINEGDEFYVEQATNSSLILKLEKDNVDFKIGLIG